MQPSKKGGKNSCLRIPRNVFFSASSIAFLIAAPSAVKAEKREIVIIERQCHGELWDLPNKNNEKTNIYIYCIFLQKQIQIREFLCCIIGDFRTALGGHLTATAAAAVATAAIPVRQKRRKGDFPIFLDKKNEIRFSFTVTWKKKLYLRRRREGRRKNPFLGGGGHWAGRKKCR